MEPLNLLHEDGNLQLTAIISNDPFLLELGNIIEGVHWHTKYPLGYRSVRTMNAEAFLCEIIAGTEPPAFIQILRFGVSRLIWFQIADSDKPMWERSQFVMETDNPADIVRADARWERTNSASEI